MSHERKISVVVLGSEESLKRALITNILANDSPRKRNVLKKTEIHENERYRVMYTPNLSSAREDIKELYAISPYPDMSLLIVKEGFSPEEVWKQIEELSRITGKPTEDFIVVLPLSYKHPEPYLFRFCTMEQLYSELIRLAKDRFLMPANTSYAESTSYTSMETAGVGYNNERSTAPKKTPKGNHPATRVNLVLLGMAGTGKSASGNTILGEPIFTSRASSDLITRECHAKDTVIGGRRVRVIDTPDIFDDDIKPDIREQHVRKCRELCEQEPCVFLLVIHISRFTDGERNILNKLAAAFGNRVHEQTVILFTRGQDLKQGGTSFEEFLHNSSSDLKKIVSMCGNRCVLFENNASPSHRQVERLMQTVVKILK
ncbi:GTPase IMAP family member 4-like [Sebastes fasciatus]|uniref:GTPase IMAP family member 4-like n=1 Tax=Sebastes fasciatus TaxID=394691 RepID=UPI003D9EF24B